MTRFILMPRRAGKSSLGEFLRNHPELITYDGKEFKLNTELTVVFDEIHDATREVIGNAAQPDQYRIQHGPVRKGRGGKPKRW